MKRALVILCAALMILALVPSVAAADKEVAIKEITCIDWQDMKTAPDTYKPALGFDGDLNTRVSIDIDSTDGEYVIIELKETAYVNALSISWNNGHTRFYDIKVETSTDNKTYKQVFKGNTGVAKEAKGYDTVKLTPSDAKYIKLTCFGKTDTADNIYDTYDPVAKKVNAWLTFWEIKVLAGDKPATTTAAATTKAAATTAAKAATTVAAKTADAGIVIAATLITAAAAAIVLKKRH